MCYRIGYKVEQDEIRLYHRLEDILCCIKLRVTIQRPAASDVLYPKRKMDRGYTEFGKQSKEKTELEDPAH